MANLIECPTCKQQISSNAASCPHCGEPIRAGKCRSKKGGFISLGAGLGIAAVCIAICPRDDGSDLFRTMVSVAIMALILGGVGACICFTSPLK